MFFSQFDKSRVLYCTPCPEFFRPTINVASGFGIVLLVGLTYWCACRQTSPQRQSNLSWSLKEANRRLTFHLPACLHDLLTRLLVGLQARLPVRGPCSGPAYSPRHSCKSKREAENVVNSCSLSNGFVGVNKCWGCVFL